MISRRMKTVSVALLISWSVGLAIGTAAEPDKAPGFESDIVPILQAKCWACHSGASPQAGLDLRSPDSILKGGKSGPAVKPGSSAGSLLIEKVTSKVMPPGAGKLSE